MSWKHLVTLVVLTILTALPVSGTVCAMLCDSAANSTAQASVHHHGSTSSVEDSARPYTEVQIHGVSDDDCSSHDAELWQASATAAERADWGVTSNTLATTDAPGTFNTLSESGPHFEYSATQGTAPPTTTPLVLRV